VAVDCAGWAPKFGVGISKHRPKLIEDLENDYANILALVFMRLIRNEEKASAKNDEIFP
jgi:hypothetical protein